MLALIRPDDRTPEERFRDAIDDAHDESEAYKAEKRRRLHVTPIRIALSVLAIMFGMTDWNIGFKYSVHTAFLVVLAALWGFLFATVLGFEILEREK